MTQVKDEVAEYESIRGYWTTVHLRTSMTWPLNKMLCEYRRRTIIILPAGEDILPAIAVVDEGRYTGSLETDRLLLNFISALTWVKRFPIEIVGLSGAGMGPFRWGKMADQGMTVAETIHIPRLPDPADRNPRVALALYREAMGSKNIAYSFLSYFKVLNLRFASGSEQKDWINNNTGNLQSSEAITRFEELRRIEPNIGEYLYSSGRCAVAHANQNVIIDPDKPEDERRLRSDLPLIKDLAELLIEQEFGVQR